MDPGGRVTVLHVDDEPSVAEVTAQCLEREDDRITVETAAGASEGLDRLATCDVDCVVSDYEMPDMDGIEFLEAVRAEYPDLPFILYTGKGSEEIASEAISAGVTDYLQKGTDASQYAVLANRVTNAVATHRSQERAQVMHRTQRILRDVNQRLVRAEGRAEIESAVCTILSETDPYRLAWIGDVESRPIEPVASAGATGYIEDGVPGDGETWGEPVRRAASERRLAGVESLAGDESWHERAREHGFRGVAAVPLVHDETVHGVLVVYSATAGFLADRERDLLIELGEDIGHALHRVESERRLREQRADLRVYERAVASSSDLLAGIDDEYTLIFANERYREFHGIDESAIGETTLPAVLGETWDEEIQQREEAVLAGEEARYEVDRTGADGQERTFSVRDYPLRDDDGSILGVVGSMRDITERKARERELRRVNERLDLAVEAATIGVWDWHVPTDEVQFNDQWAAMLGYDPDDIDPHLDAWKRRVHPEDLPRAQTALEAHLAGETDRYECDHRLRTAEGDWTWIRDIGRVTERDEAGNPVRAVGVHLDIDDRDRHEETKSSD